MRCAALDSNAAALKAKGNVAGTDRTEEWFAVYLNVFFRVLDGLNIHLGSKSTPFKTLFRSSYFDLKMTCFVGFTVACFAGSSLINDVIPEFCLPNNSDQASK